MSSRRFVSSLLPALALSLLSPLPHGAVQNRIASAANGNSRVAVPGTISGHVKYSVDLGAAPAGKKLDTITLRFNMTAAQQASLTALQAAQLTPGSPSYHQW